MTGVTLDAGALIALDRSDRRVLVLLARAHEVGARVIVPATALAQAIRRPRTQVRLARLIRQPTTESFTWYALGSRGYRGVAHGTALRCAAPEASPVLLDCTREAGLSTCVPRRERE